MCNTVSANFETIRYFYYILQYALIIREKLILTNDRTCLIYINENMIKLCKIYLVTFLSV